MAIRGEPPFDMEAVPNPPTPNEDKLWGNAQRLTPFMLYVIEHKVSSVLVVLCDCTVGFGHQFGALLLLAREFRLTLYYPFQ